MTALILICSIIGGIIGLFLIARFFQMCKDVETITKILKEATNTKTIESK